MTKSRRNHQKQSINFRAGFIPLEVKNLSQRHRDTSKKLLTGFTLVELLVVIAIIALLMSVLMPALARVRKQAKTALCLSNLKQLAACFSMYANENDGFFPIGWLDDNLGVQNPKYYWMEALRPCYGDSGDIRLCPAATRISSKYHPPDEYNSLGRTDGAWGIFSGEPGKTSSAWGWVIAGDYGSYGWNSFVCNTPDFIGDKEVNTWAKPSVYNWKRADVKGANKIPLLGDHKWLDCWPHHGDEPPQYDGDAYTSQMTRVCMNRHEGYVCWSFLDYSVRKVGLKELWRLQWSKPFDTTDGPTKEEWPDWMKGFKEYK
jgi:prepilin-type N-terminal cleavage/methylation domain-containing protein